MKACTIFTRNIITIFKILILLRAMLEPFNVTKQTSDSLLTSRRQLKRKLTDISEDVEVLLKEKSINFHAGTMFCENFLP